MSQTWKELSDKLYGKVPLMIRHSLIEELDQGPFNQDYLPTPETLYTESEFWNVVGALPALWQDEFSQQPQVAVYLKDGEVVPEGVQRIYCQPRVHLSETSTELAKSSLAINCGLDPYSLGLWDGKLYRSDYDWEVLNQLEQRIFRFSGQAYQMAGASESQQLAILLASLTQLFKDSDGRIGLELLLAKVSFELSLETNFSVSVAQIRALNWLLSRLQEIYEIKLQDIPVFVLPSPRVMSRREPWGNIMRQTVIAAAARLGGASGFIALPFDMLSREPTGHRTSRNIDLILSQESHFVHLTNATQGSFTIDRLTQSLSAQSWIFFQEIEAKGGLVASINSGWLQGEIAAYAATGAKRVESRADQFIGGNQHVLNHPLSEQYPLAKKSQVLELEDWWLNWQDHGVPLETLSVVKKLVPRSTLETFESWQFTSDQWREQDHIKSVIGLLIEPDMAAAKKVLHLRKTMGLMGLDISAKAEQAKVWIVIARDPEGDFVAGAVKELRAKNAELIFWSGEKTFAGFDGQIGENPDLENIFSKIEQVFKGGL